MNSLDVSDLSALFMLTESSSIAVRLLQQTRVGLRQWTTAQALIAAIVPLTPVHLMAVVAERVGQHCYGAKPAYTLHTDIHALKQAGLPVHFSRVPGHSGYYLLDAQAEAQERAQILLRRVGWHPSDWQQIGVYAQMPPARKVSQLFNLRHAFMNQLRSRLRADHPQASEREIATLVLRELADVREFILGE